MKINNKTFTLRNRDKFNLLQITLFKISYKTTHGHLQGTDTLQTPSMQPLEIFKTTSRLHQDILKTTSRHNPDTFQPLTRHPPDIYRVIGKDWEL